MSITSLVFTLIRLFGYPIIVAGETLEGMGIPVPGETILISASAYAANSNDLNIIYIVILSTAGAFLGDNIGYYLGAKKGMPFLYKHEKRLKSFKIDIKKINSYFEKNGGWIVFAGRFTTLLRMFSPMLAGINKMDYKKFAFFNFLGCFLWSLLYGILGYYLGKNIPLLIKVSERLGLGLLFVAISAIILSIIAFKYAKSRKK